MVVNPRSLSLTARKECLIQDRVVECLCGESKKRCSCVCCMVIRKKFSHYYFFFNSLYAYTRVSSIPCVYFRIILIMRILCTCNITLFLSIFLYRFILFSPFLFSPNVSALFGRGYNCAGYMYPRIQYTIYTL